MAYVINSFDRGGAEFGLLNLIAGGLFAGMDLEVIALAQGTGEVKTRLTEIGVSPTVLLDRPRMRVRDMPVLLMRLWRALRRRAPDIVIGSLPQANLLARLYALLRPSILFVSFEHNTHLAKRAYEVGFRLTSRRVDWTFADSQTTLDVARTRLYSPPPRGVRKVVPLLSFAQPAAAARRHVPGRPFHIINAARFTPAKNQAALLRAIAVLTNDGRCVRLTLYGDGPERAACQRLAEQLQIRELVDFPGFVGDWPQRPADLFVLSSSHEGLCMVVLEAMHAGIPVAAPAIGGIRDHAAPYLATALESTEPAAIARGIAAVIDDDTVAAKAAMAATMIDQKFGQVAVQQVYRQVNREVWEAIQERKRDTEREGAVRRSL